MQSRRPGRWLAVMIVLLCALAPSAANLPVPYVAFRVNGATIATTSPTRPANPVDGMVVLDRRLGCLIWWDATKKRWRRTGNGVAV